LKFSENPFSGELNVEPERAVSFQADSPSLDDLDIEDLHFYDDVGKMIVILAVKRSSRIEGRRSGEN
jgi:hypothetical protein